MLTNSLVFADIPTAILKAVLFVSLSGAGLQAQSRDLPPVGLLNATDVFTAFRLPPLKEHSGQAPATAVSTLGVMKRARALGITARTATEAWLRAQTLLAATDTSVPVSAGSPAPFSGASASALNRILAAPSTTWVRVTSSTLNVDEPIRLARPDVNLDLGSTRLRTETAAHYLVRIENTSGVVLTGGNFVSGESAILINASDRVTVRDTNIAGLSGDGIVVTRSTATIIRNNHISGLGGASIVLHGATKSSVVERNEIVGSRGFSNMDAAILVSDRNVDLSEKAGNIFGEDGYSPVFQPLMQRLQSPANNVIALNKLTGNASSGVYVDGGIATVIALNFIQGNAKEGVCLDNGAASNVITLNNIVQNGSRWGQSDSIMEKDRITAGGRLQDGTPAAKVPGISIDNSVYNVIFSNDLSHNFGGGIKIVRTGYFNVIGLNTIFSNNDGAGDRFHFFGVELGSAALDDPSVELDATPSRGNIVFSNTVRGTHYAGIFFAAGSDYNDVFDNIIMDSTNWALESVEPLPNSSLNNLTNIPSRNIGAGLSSILPDPGPNKIDPNAKKK